MLRNPFYNDGLVFNATINNISVIYLCIVAVSFIGGGNQSTQRKP
jgi:hypothetical protein